MSKGFLFSGQGAQAVGMGKELCEKHPEAKARFEEASDVLGYNLAKLCFEGPKAELTQTAVCQPALYVHGMVAFEALQRAGETPAICLGLSLGELTAHAAAGTVNFETGLKLVAERARLMQAACEETKGGMASLLGGQLTVIEKLCKQFDVEISNFNCPGQTVVSGDAKNIEALVSAAGNISSEDGGFKRVIPLNVAGAYHSKLMRSAAQRFEAFIDGVSMSAPKVPVLSNVTGKAESDPQTIKALLVKQITHAVRWEACMRTAAQTTTQFYECGPGNTLAGLARRTDKTYTVTAAG